MMNRSLIFHTFQKINAFNDVIRFSDDISDNSVQCISNMEQQILEPGCRIAVVGEFNRGKTSFINAILGEKILPESVSPWTAVQTEIAFSEIEMASIWTETGYKRNIAREQLENWLTKSDKQSEKAKKARIGIPASFLQDNEVTLIDTPGLNDHEDLDYRTFDAVRDADIMIWMLSSSSPFSNSELNYVIDLVRQSIVRHVIFVMNKIDAVEEEDIDKLLNVVYQRINEMTRETTEKEAFLFNGEILVYGFSAWNALKARKNRKDALLWESGLPQLQKKLEEVIEVTRYEKQTVDILATLSRQSKHERDLCADKVAQWNDEVILMESCLCELEPLENYFNNSIIEQARFIGSNYKRRVNSYTFSIQSQFCQNIYAKGYGILSLCCNDANTYGNKQRDTLLQEISTELMNIYYAQRDNFFAKFSGVISRSGLGENDGYFLDDDDIIIQNYIPCFCFDVLNFPGLLFKRNPVAREEYLDRIAEQEVNRIADKWENGVISWASNITQKMNNKANEIVNQQKALLNSRANE